MSVIEAGDLPLVVPGSLIANGPAGLSSIWSQYGPTIIGAARDWFSTLDEGAQASGRLLGHGVSGYRQGGPVGGLAGLAYGVASNPDYWINRNTTYQLNRTNSTNTTIPMLMPAATPPIGFYSSPAEYPSGGGYRSFSRGSRYPRTPYGYRRSKSDYQRGYRYGRSYIPRARGARDRYGSPWRFGRRIVYRRGYKPKVYHAYRRVW